MPLAQRLIAFVAEAGYGPCEPVIVGVNHQRQAPVFAAQGTTRRGEPLDSTTVVYAASLSKQITAACAALLVRDGALDIEAPLAEWLPELPTWANAVRLRHLVFHTAALPDAKVDDVLGDDDRTTPAVLAALMEVSALAGPPPGVTFAYSGVGYICLALAVERATGQPLAGFADERIFGLLGMNDTCYWPGPASAPPGAAPLAPPHPAPLSLGDGGVWSTASDLLRWGQALNGDQLGISHLMETHGRLDNGALLDYAWGIGVRTHRGHRVYRHGGGWPSLRALHARIPDLNSTFVILATADESERRVDLAARMLDTVTAPPAS